MVDDVGVCVCIKREEEDDVRGGRMVVGNKKDEFVCFFF